MTVRELAEFVLNHDIDTVIAKCEEILNEEEEEEVKMTDEEMAEGYYNSKFKSNESHFSKFDIEQSYLAGLKAGTPEWHEIGSKVTPVGEISKQYMPKNKEKVLLKYHFSGDDEVYAWCYTPEPPEFPKESEQMKPRLINANALMEYCQNQMDKKIDCNDIARFPTYPTDEWHYIKNKDFPNTKGEYLVCRSKSKYSILAFDGSFWITGVQDDPYDSIIAWKEIVLPKENE